jgi:hypothetical protein
MEAGAAKTFPRLGQEWIYWVENAGFAEGDRTVSLITYRIESPHPDKKRWLTSITYGELVAITMSREYITEESILFHPPRALAYRSLQWAPFPRAHPNNTGVFHDEFILGPGWAPPAGETIPQTYEEIGFTEVEVPMGRFAQAWLVEGTTPLWNASFWWVERVGFVRMEFNDNNGRTVKLLLREIKG